MISPIALGTVQLGVTYGIANRLGKPDRDSSLEILETAWEQGIRCFDTARAYGESETVLGAFFAQFPGRMASAQIVTKLAPNFTDDQHSDLAVAVRECLDKLQCPELWGLLLHREEEMDNLTQELLRQIQSLRDEKFLRHFGVSCQTPEGACRALEIDAIDVIQIPSSVFDSRWIDERIPQRIHECGKQLFIRSIYLQGLALMIPEEVPKGIPGGKDAVKQIAGFCEAHNLSRDHFCLSYIQKRIPHAVPVLGAETSEQVLRNTGIAMDDTISLEIFDEWDERYRLSDPLLTDPSKWTT
ncbi:MAG: aldo/keto reductase [Verrucomicrobiales bacterium]|nr:aldo/keto reductase [Verrucomicrobiales bacterium]